MQKPRWNEATQQWEAILDCGTVVRHESLTVLRDFLDYLDNLNATTGRAGHAVGRDAAGPDGDKQAAVAKPTATYTAATKQADKIAFATAVIFWCIVGVLTIVAVKLW